MQGDLISRHAVIDALHSKFAYGFDIDRWWNSTSVLYAINGVPSVNPQKIGHWIEPKDFMWENPKCSECGFESADHDNYCPHCGAKML